MGRACWWWHYPQVELKIVVFFSLRSVSICRYSVNRLRQLLGCYNALTPVVLGERYGFNLRHSQGYNYITGGGGIVFSRALLEKLVLSTCKCPTISSPDDMYLAGICIKLMGLAVTHSPLFHQVNNQLQFDLYSLVLYDFPGETEWLSARVSNDKRRRVVS